MANEILGAWPGDETDAELQDALKDHRHGGQVAKPPIVCLCGSTRFMEAFFEAGWGFTLLDVIVLSVGVCKHAKDHGGEALGQDVADRLDELHKRKIDLADFVYVLNVGGYIGSSTQSEIDYADKIKKPVYLMTVYTPEEALEEWEGEVKNENG